MRPFTVGDVSDKFMLHMPLMFLNVKLLPLNLLGYTILRQALTCQDGTRIHLPLELWLEIFDLAQPKLPGFRYVRVLSIESALRHTTLHCVNSRITNAPKCSSLSMIAAVREFECFLAAPNRFTSKTWPFHKIQAVKTTPNQNEIFSIVLNDQTLLQPCLFFNIAVPNVIAFNENS